MVGRHAHPRAAPLTSSGRWRPPRRPRPRPGARARARSAGLVSASRWWRRLTLPSAWKVWATGTPRRRPARSAARPDIQKCPCTTSGSPVRAQSPRHPVGELVHVRQQLVLGHVPRRARGHVHDGDARRRPARARAGRVVAAGVDRRPRARAGPGRAPARPRARSGRRRPPRRARRAGSRARTPWRSSRCHLLEDAVPVEEEPGEGEAVEGVGRAPPGRGRGPRRGRRAAAARWPAAGRGRW